MFDINTTVNSVVNYYVGISNTLPSWGQTFLSLFLILVVISLYLLFVRGFYGSVSKKDLFGLNLNQYNKYQLPFAYILYKSFLYLLEYIIIVPFVVFFWFSIFSIFLLILTNAPVSTILLVSAVVVLASRLASYYKKGLSENVAKLLPYNLLAFALLNPGFFSFDKILNHFAAIPSLFGQIIDYLLFIIAFEVIMRVFSFIVSLFDIHFEKKEKEEEAGEAIIPEVKET